MNYVEDERPESIGQGQRLPPAGGGQNPVDILAQLLFHSAPLGLGLSTDEWDLASFVAARQVLYSEGAGFSVIAQDGAEAQEVIGNLLQDAGIMVTRDPISGKNKLYVVREEEDPLTTIVEQQELGPEPEIETVHAERSVDRAMFAFSDQARQFRDTVVGIDDDGQQLETGNVRGTVGRITSVVDFHSAGIVAERRSQEELAAPARYQVYAGRDARLLTPGQAIRVEGIPFVLRVSEVDVMDVRSSKVKLDCMPDHYGAPATSYEHDDDAVVIDGQAEDVAANEREAWLEIPEHVAGAGVVQVAALRVRAHQQILLQSIHLSADGSTYKEVEADASVHAGGALTEQLDADTAHVIEDGPTFDLEGPDVDEVLDLSGNEARWRRGDQLCVIGEEIFFLRGVEALGGASYRLKGLIRARYDTQRATHAVGAAVFIFSEGLLVPQIDALIFPGQTLYVKQQPSAPAGELDLASVTAVSKTVKGKGVVPMRPGALRVVAPAKGVPAYATGEDVEFAWCYRSSQYQGTGLGMQPAGAAVGVSAPVGTFEVQVYDESDTLVATYGEDDGVTATGWTYTNADLQTDLGGETNFRIEVRNVNGGYRSDSCDLEVTAL